MALHMFLFPIYKSNIVHLPLKSKFFLHPTCKFNMKCFRSRVCHLVLLGCRHQNVIANKSVHSSICAMKYLSTIHNYAFRFAHAAKKDYEVLLQSCVHLRVGSGRDHYVGQYDRWVNDLYDRFVYLSKLYMIVYAGHFPPRNP